MHRIIARAGTDVTILSVQIGEDHVVQVQLETWSNQHQGCILDRSDNRKSIREESPQVLGNGTQMSLQCSITLGIKLTPIRCNVVWLPTATEYGRHHGMLTPQQQALGCLGAEDRSLAKAQHG